MTIRSAVSVRLFFIRRSHATSLTHIPCPYINRIGLPRTVISALSPSHHTGHYNWPQIKSYYRTPFPPPNCSDGILLWNHRQVRIPSWKSDYDPSHISALQILPVLQSLVSSFYPTPLHPGSFIPSSSLPCFSSRQSHIYWRFRIESLSSEYGNK